MERDKVLQTYNFTGLASHSIHLHAVLAKCRVKHTANIIYIIMTFKKKLKWIKSPSNPNPKKKKGMAENKPTLTI